jgi:hypothetical protein
MKGAMPGSGLLRIAERLFDRATLDRVIVPAIADLQHECARATSMSSAGLSNRLIRFRAYWGVVRTIVLCAARDVVIDRDSVSRSVGWRMLILVPLLVALFTLPAIGEFVSLGAKFGAALATRAGLLLLLPAVVVALPIAFYFAVALHRREPGHQSLPEGLSVAALSAVCVAAMSLLMLTIVPETNQIYRVTLFKAFQSLNVDGPRPQHLPKGLAEMTSTELNAHIAHPPSQAQGARARRHRHERFAFIMSAPLLGFVGLALARRRSSRPLTIAVAFVLLGLYYACFNTGLLRVVGMDVYRAWAADVLLILIGCGLFQMTPRRTLALEAER